METNPTYTIAFVLTTFPPEISGGALYNWDRVQWFATQGIYRVVVLAPDCQNTLKLPSIAPELAENLIIEYYPSKSWLFYPLHYVPTFSAIRQINQRLAYYNPQLIIMGEVERFFLFSTWQLPGRQYAKDHNIPCLTECQTDFYNFSSAYRAGKFLKEIFLRPVIKYLYSKFDTTIVSSRFASKVLQSLGVDNTEIIPFVGIDTSIYSPERRNREELNPWLSDEEQDHKVILFLGRLAFEKRIDILIKAFAQLKHRQSNFSLIIAGDGPSEVVNHLKRLAQKIPHVHFVGFVRGESKANLLASCDIFCSPSPYETFGLTVVEAMASGLPVVTVNSGAVADTINNEVNGYLVAPNAVDELSCVLEKISSSNNTNIIHQALQDAKKFSVEQGCQNLNHYYQKVLNSKLNQKETNSTVLIRT